MQFKKNTISHLVWMIAMATMVFIAIKYAILFDTYFVEGNIAFFEKLDYVTSIGLCCVAFFISTLILFFAGWVIAYLVRRFINLRDVYVQVLEKIILTVAIVATILNRISILLDSHNLVLTNDKYFEIAKVTGNSFLRYFDGSFHGATYIYVTMLSAFMMFLGNTVTAVVILQFVIQVLSILLVYGIGKRIYGFSVGLVASTVFGLVPMYTEKMFEATPGCFVGLLILTAIYLICCHKDMENDGIKIAFAIFTGLLIGVMTYCDAYVLLSLIVFVCALIFEINHSEEESDISPVICYIVLLICIIIGFFVTVLVDVLSASSTIPHVLGTWFNCIYSSNLPGYFYRDPIMENPSIPICIGMVSLAFMSAIGFKKKEYCDELPIWLLMLLVAVTPLTIIGYLQDDAFPLAVYSILAGVGVRNMLCKAIDNETEAAIDSAVDYIEQINKQEESVLADKETTANQENNNSDDAAVEEIALSKKDKKKAAKEEKKLAKEEKKNAKAEKKNVKKDKENEKETEDNSAEDNKNTKVGDKKAAKEDKKKLKEEKKNKKKNKNENIDSLNTSSDDNVSAIVDAGSDDKTDAIVDNTANVDIASDKSTKVELPKIESEQVVDNVKPVSKTDKIIAKPIKQEPVKYTKQVDERPGMIPNPLPLPAKRIHAPIDYKYDVTDDLMHYDTEVNDDDNFDI